MRRASALLGLCGLLIATLVAPAAARDDGRAGETLRRLIEVTNA